MGSRRLTFAAFPVAAVMLATAAPPAAADERIVARSVNEFANPRVTIDAGERLTFRNDDFADHNVTARMSSGGRPLFASDTIGRGREVDVERAASLAAGAYDFLCTIHPSEMTGTLTVTGTGAQPQPDTTAPRLRLSIRRTTLSRLERSRRMLVNVSLDEAATVTLRATARVRGRTVTLARGRTRAGDAGRRRASMRLTRAGRRVVASARRLVVTVRGSAADPSGNRSRARARRTLR